FALLACTAAWSQQPAPQELVRKLQSGGYVLYMRHASTDFSKNDANMRSYEDCDNQRNLTDKGREEARQIGAHLKRLKIPLGTVLASPYCRTMESARLAFGDPQAVQEVRGGPSRTDDPARYEPLKKLLSTRPAAKQNTAIASHGNPFHAVAGPPYLAEGEIAVVQPQGGASFTVVGRIRPEDWPKLN
ncbi:MAG TPA: histidine phosphatase family protein, partial [Kofleriaceae bacterium]|nr:histidine phosphatase family protein [Kofleriaceae bacterium]